MYDNKDASAKMVGETTSILMVDKDSQRSIHFLMKSGKRFEWDTEGDCCSESWFADINGVDNLLNAEIISVESVSVPDVDDNRTRQEYDQLYGFKITTDRGYCDIVFRNSSNGAYGGWCDISEVTEFPDNLVEIRENDWRA